MVKGSRRMALGFLLMPLLYAAFLRLNGSLPHSWKFQHLSWQANSLSIQREDDTGRLRGTEYTRFLLMRLVRGRARRELSWNGISCVTSRESDICVTTSAVRIVAGPIRSPTIYLTAGQSPPAAVAAAAGEFTVQPYPRKTDEMAMSRVAPVRIISSSSPGSGAGESPPPCDIVHTVPAVVFSTGGFAGNFYHDINDVLLPLFATAAQFRSQVRLVVTDYEHYWVRKYRRVLAVLADRDVVIASSPSSDVEITRAVHCFPAGAAVGVKYYDNLAVDPTAGAGTLRDFCRFLRKSFSLKNERINDTWNRVTPPLVPPLLVLLSRRRTRVLLNEAAVAEVARGVGFRVELATREMMASERLAEFAGLVNSCGVLMGVHGAGMTNMVFMPERAVVVQVVPLGLDWAARVYYGQPAVAMGLGYVEYRTAAEESTLSEEYPPEHPVIADPWSINLQGYNVSRPLYTDGQNVTLDLSRVRESLLQAMHLLLQQQ